MLPLHFLSFPHAWLLSFKFCSSAVPLSQKLMVYGPHSIILTHYSAFSRAPHILSHCFMTCSAPTIPSFFDKILSPPCHLEDFFSPRAERLLLFQAHAPFPRISSPGLTDWLSELTTQLTFTDLKLNSQDFFPRCCQSCLWKWVSLKTVLNSEFSPDCCLLPPTIFQQSHFSYMNKNFKHFNGDIKFGFTWFSQLPQVSHRKPDSTALFLAFFINNSFIEIY